MIVTTATAQESPAHTTPVEQAFETVETHTVSVGDAAHAADGHVGYDVFPPFDFATYPSQLLWLAICFAALYLILSRAALPQIGSILENRRAIIDADIAAADASREKTDAAIAAYEEALAAARRNAQALAEQTKATISADLAAKRKDVEADLAHKVAEAEARITATKTEALGHVDEIATETTQALVGALFQPVGEAEARDAVAQVSKE